MFCHLHIAGYMNIQYSISSYSVAGARPGAVSPATQHVVIRNNKKYDRTRDAT